MVKLEEGRFYLRIHKCDEAPEIEGAVVYLREITPDGLSISGTEDCRPLDTVIHLSNLMCDNGWQDVTGLIMQANMVILPKYNSCNFESDISLAYRNYINMDVKPINPYNAVGKLCVIGNTEGKRISYSKFAYFIVAVDDNGYIIAYSGFCLPLDNSGAPRTPQQKILRLVGTNRHLYLASEVVSTCNAVYFEDMRSLDTYRTRIEEAIASSSVEAEEVSRQHTNKNVRGMDLK